MYFSCDEDTQWVYREWARAIAEGRATMDKPPKALEKLLHKQSQKSSKKKRSSASGNSVRNNGKRNALAALLL